MIFPFLGAVACIILAAITDWREYRIPNKLIVAIVIFAMIYALIRGSMEAVAWREAIFIFAVASALYAMRLMGGGDVKLLGACALWCPGNIIDFMLVTAFSGGFLALLQLGRVYFSEQKNTQVPYGVAISAGALAGMVNHFFILNR